MQRPNFNAQGCMKMQSGLHQDPRTALHPSLMLEPTSFTASYYPTLRCKKEFNILVPRRFQMSNSKQPRSNAMHAVTAGFIRILFVFSLSSRPPFVLNIGLTPSLSWCNATWQCCSSFGMSSQSCVRHFRGPPGFGFTVNLQISFLGGFVASSSTKNAHN